jgi:polyhydroxyalkanoate synthase
MLLLAQGINDYTDLKPCNMSLSGNNALSIGSSSLYEYADSGLPVLLIPSMINKSYIMDLPGESLAKALCAQGFKPYIIEWGDPGKIEEGMDLNNYILTRLNQFVDYVIATESKPPVLMGYCMGGIMAALYASVQPEKVKAIVQLATPWDFATNGFIKVAPDKLKECFEYHDIVPKEFFQIGFYLKRFADVNHKYIKFAKKQLNTDDFTCIETWNDDGINMPKHVFAQFMDDIIYQNKLIQGSFCINDVSYNMNSIIAPTLSFIATRDSITSVDSAMAIKNIVPSSDVVYIHTSHVGLATRSRIEVAESIKIWLEYKKINKAALVC